MLRLASGTRIFSVPETVPLNTTKYGIHGTYDLEIKDLVWQDGGVYGCSVFSNPTVQKAHVFVFGECLKLGSQNSGPP